MQPVSEDNSANEARKHAWDWFALHAAQRMTTFNFFLVVTGFLVAAYASLLESHPRGAMVVAIVGAWLAIWFNRIDARARQLIKASERALIVAQEALAKATKWEEMRILEAVEAAEPGSSSYRRVIVVIAWTIFLMFLAGALYAAQQSFSIPPKV